jgi:hypothetical protein
MNLNNTGQLDDNEDDVIYRYIRFFHLRQQLLDQVVLFSRPEMWTDKLENPILSSRGIYLNDESIGFSRSLTRIAFAQCWTYQKDIQEWCWWRYHDADDIIRVGFKRAAYENAIMDAFGGESSHSVFCQRVNYHDNLEDLRATIREDLINCFGKSNDIVSPIARSLFHKLSYHKAEDEYRIVVMDHKSFAIASERFFGVKVNAAPHVVSIDTGPRCSPEIVAEIHAFAQSLFNRVIAVTPHQDHSFRNEIWHLD